MKKVLGLIIAASFATSALAVDSYSIDQSHTFPSFEINHLGFSTQRGRFNKTSGKIILDRAAKTGSIEVSIDAASIDTGLEELHKHLKAEDFFDVAQYPTLNFKSNKLKFDGEQVVAAEGELTLRGVTKPVSLKVEAFKCAIHPMNKKSMCGANVVTTIKRSDFGMSKYVPAVGDEVKIAIQIEAVKD
ncbi:MAG: YceI family protein [Pseudomonadota bacterium]